MAEKKRILLLPGLEKYYAYWRFLSRLFHCQPRQYIPLLYYWLRGAFRWLDAFLITNFSSSPTTCNKAIYFLNWALFAETSSQKFIANIIIINIVIVININLIVNVNAGSVTAMVITSSQLWSSQLWTQFKQLRKPEKVRTSTGWTRDPVEVLAFSGFRNCLICVHNCDGHIWLDLKSAVQNMKHFVYHYTWSLLLFRLFKMAVPKLAVCLVTEQQTFTKWSNVNSTPLYQSASIDEFVN